MIDMSDNSKWPTNASTEDTLQQFRDRIALRTRGLNDTYAETHNISTLQNQDKQLKERYKVTSNDKYTTEQDYHSATNETTEHKLHDVRRQTSELQAQSKNTELIPKASHYVYSPHMATSNSTPVSSRISNICSPTDNFPLPTSSTIPAGPTSPQRRRIKYPPFDGIETDIDCSTEMGHGLHLEVRKIYNLLQEKDDTIKFIEIAKINAESNMYNSAKKLKVKEESEERLKDQCWDLEVTNQGLIAQITELQHKLARKTIDYNRVASKLGALTEESDMLRNTNEQQSQVVKRLQKEVNNPSPSKRTRKKKCDISGYSPRSSLLSIPAKLESTRSMSIASIATSVADSDASDTPKQNLGSTISPSSSVETTKDTEAEALKYSLSHAHRTIAQLRAWLHMERTEKIETKRLLSESQETIEKLRRKKNVWNDEEPSTQLSTPNIRMVPSNRRGAARYARGLIDSCEVDLECDIQPGQVEEDFQPLVEAPEAIDTTVQQNKEFFRPPTEAAIDDFCTPIKMRSLGEELHLASPPVLMVENPAEDEDQKSAEGDQVIQPSNSSHMSNACQTKSQVAYHAKRASPKRRNIDSSKECSLPRSLKLRDLNSNSYSHLEGKQQELPVPKPRLSDTTKRKSGESIVMEPSHSEPRVPALNETLLPPTFNLEEIHFRKEDEKRMSHGSKYGLADMIARLQHYATNNRRRSIPRTIRKSTDSQRSTSTRVSRHWRSSSTGDIIPSHMDDNTGDLGLLTQTMIGAWMWKYTRKTVGNGYSDKPHKRFCWIHPYTRTLYWSTAEPGVGEAESKAKSAFIESVMVIADDPDMSGRDMSKPSLVIKTSTRELKLKAADDARHSMWFEALRYLLLRTSPASSIDLPMQAKPNNQRRNEVLTFTISQALLLRKPSNSRVSSYNEKFDSSERNKSTFFALSTLFHRPSSAAAEVASAPTTTAPPKQQRTLSHRMCMRLRPLSTVSSSLRLPPRQS